MWRSVLPAPSSGPSRSGSCTRTRRGSPRTAKPRHSPLAARWQRAGSAARRMNSMTRLTRDDVIKVIAEADDVAIAEIIGTGATAEELAEAQAWLANDEPLMNAGKPLPNRPVGELVEILEELEAEDDKEKDAGVVVGEG